jgi:hypothetical protein
MPAGGLKVASLRRRFAAGLISLFAVAAPFLGGVVGCCFVYEKYMRRRGAESRGWSLPELSQRWERPLSAASFAFEIQMRNWRGPGYRLLGLRRVNARTGGPVSVHSAVVEWVWAHATSQMTRVLMRPQQARRDERLAAFKAEMEEFERAHAGDHEAIEREQREAFKRHDLGLGYSCLVPIAPGLLINLASVCLPPHQTVAQRLAGTVVIED